MSAAILSERLPRSDARGPAPRRRASRTSGRPGRQDVEKRRFAAAGRSEEDDELAPLQVEVEAPQRLNLDFAHLVGLDEAAGSNSGGCSLSHDASAFSGFLWRYHQETLERIEDESGVRGEHLARHARLLGKKHSVEHRVVCFEKTHQHVERKILSDAPESLAGLNDGSKDRLAFREHRREARVSSLHFRHLNRYLKQVAGRIERSAPKPDEPLDRRPKVVLAQPIEGRHWQPGEEHVGSTFQSRREEIVLVVEVVVIGTLADARFGQNVVQGRSLQSPLGKMSCRDVEEALPRFLSQVKKSRPRH